MLSLDLIAGPPGGPSLDDNTAEPVSNPKDSANAQPSRAGVCNFRNIALVIYAIALVTLLVINTTHIAGGVEGNLCSYISLASFSVTLLLFVAMMAKHNFNPCKEKSLFLPLTLFAAYVILFSLSTSGVIGHHISSYAWFGLIGLPWVVVIIKGAVTGVARDMRGRQLNSSKSDYD